MSSDLSVPLETYFSTGPEDNLRHGSEEANTPPVIETMNLDDPLV